MDANVDVWMKEIAPSADLCAWFGHDPERFDAFRAAYEQQLVEDEAHIEAVKQVIAWTRLGPVTLLYGAKDPVCNHAIILHNFIADRIESPLHAD